jgi:hypothetical protein
MHRILSASAAHGHPEDNMNIEHVYCIGLQPPKVAV